MKRILLTGASGFLGNYILEYLRESNHQVDTLGRNTGSSIVADLAKDSPRFQMTYDLVVHCAAMLRVGVADNDRTHWISVRYNIKYSFKLARRAIEQEFFGFWGLWHCYSGGYYC